MRLSGDWSSEVCSADLVALTFPALSVQVPEAERLVPSALRVTGASQWSIPESVSAPVNVTVTLVLFQPFALGPGEAVAVVVGGVLSILMLFAVADAGFPATS